MPQDALAAELAIACKAFHDGRNSSDGGRDGVLRALHALTRYVLATRPDVKRQLEPLVLLETNLRNLDVGRVNQMLKPTRQNGRPPASLQRECLKQILTVAQEILMDGGHKEREAEDYVQKKLLEYGRDFSGKTLGNWRSEVREHMPCGTGSPDKLDLYRERWDAWSIMRGLHSVATKEPLMSAEAWVQKFIFNEDLRAFLD
jgi:hypothetical protein